MPDMIRAIGTGSRSDGRRRGAPRFASTLAAFAAASGFGALIAVSSPGGPAQAQDVSPLVIGLAYVEAVRNLVVVLEHKERAGETQGTERALCKG